MKNINKKIILLSLILIISCSLPLPVWSYNVDNEGFLPESVDRMDCCPST